MVDGLLRPLIDPPLNAGGRILARAGIGANTVTVAGLAVGLAAAVAIGQHAFGVGLALILINRLLDGLDGAVARARGLTDFGGYLDLLSDFAFYAAIPAAFALADPVNRLPAALLLGSFVLSGASFLGYAAIAARRGMETQAQGAKSVFYLAGLAEGTETIVAFVLSAARPDWFPAIALGFAPLCVLTALGRVMVAARTFR